MYPQVPARIESAAEMDEQVLTFWEDNQIFARSLATTQGGPAWTFYEGPPTANGKPGTHHIEARVFKDVFPRHRTMKGQHVARRAGWDCHGLPVEIAVEKELGFNGKPDIEKFGVAEFNEKCRESVLRHVDQFETMTRRMGYWVDMSDAYWTMNPDYVQSVWWSLKRIHEQGLLTQDHRVSPYCPRCGTGLSDHELAQGYEDIVDESVFVRMPVTDTDFVTKYGSTTLLVWTTTPWTLISNTAVAVKPDAEYLIARQGDEQFVVAADLADATLGEDYTIVDRLTGADLERLSYQRPFEFVEVPDANYVILGDFVTTDDGTGLVHIAPAFGADDLAVAKPYDLPVINPVDATGHFVPDVELVGGKFFKDADPALVQDLDQRGLLFRHVPFEHAYPHCWRCHTPLIYYAQPAWYIRTKQRKQAMIDQNQATNWFPPTVKNGRFGDWLTNNIDWALSRNRYWGTPLPIWICGDDHQTVVASLAELSELAGQDLSATDPHRPFVDDIHFPCPDCGGQATRVPEVIDCWYDSGSMPFAQWGYPLQNQEEFAASYPADFICEAIDQTRGWFYTLLAVGTITLDESPYKNVLCLGHILDEDGRKMSKHLGNVLDPIELMDAHGADSVRWFMLAAGSPWQARRVGHQAITEVWRKTLSTYWSTVSFQALYGRAADWTYAAEPAHPVADRHVLDRWALARAQEVVTTVDQALDEFDTQKAGAALADFIQDLSNWYVRRSRRRFWAGDNDALSTLHECLQLLTLAMAPFTPFITERVWQDLFRADSGVESVHLATWPEFTTDADATLLADMAKIRRVVELGRTARADSGVGIRQPLRCALVAAPGWADVSAELREEVCAELNVGELQSLADADDLVDVSIKPNFRALGQQFGKQTPTIAKAITALDPQAVATQLKDTGSLQLSTADLGDVTVSADAVLLTEVPREGWAVAADSGFTTALDLTLTPELERAGLARQIIRQVQEARKQAGLDVSDRITFTWDSADDQVRETMQEHGKLIADEVLAVSVVNEQPAEPTTPDGVDLAFMVAKTSA